MSRIHLFEFTDLDWYPQTFRRMQTDYLQFVAGLGSGHENLVPLMIKAMQHAGTTEIVDLCSGGTGPWRNLHRQLARAGWPVKIVLTDKFPLATCWDGIISLLRVYTPQELQGLADRVSCRDYTWEIGQASTGTPVFVFTYLIGYPLA